MLKDEVLALLLGAGDKPISGEAMREVLGVSRAAVWKGVESLRQEGYLISSATNRGYRLEGRPNKLSAEVISAALQGRVTQGDILCLDSVDSTNEEVKRLAATGVKEGLAVLSAHQTGGKGRKGRVFQSPTGGLYLSLLLRPTCAINDLFQLTAWTAVAVCKAIHRITGLDMGIKWTNDLVLEGKKLGGILTELGIEGESGAITYVAIGIGLNLQPFPDDFPPELHAVATTLSQHMEQPPRYDHLAIALLEELDKMYQDFPTQHHQYLEAYRKRCLTLGRHCHIVRHHGGTEPVFAQDIDDDFGLVVRHPDGSLETVTAGDVSVRGLFGYAQ